MQDTIRLELVPGLGRTAVFELDASGRAKSVSYEDVIFERR
jgi:hypothetical protein